MFRTVLTIGVFSSFLSACMSPAPHQPVAITQSLSGTVVVGISTASDSRSVLAKVSEVEELIARLRKPDGVEVLQRVSRAQLNAGTASVTFSDVVEGWGMLSITALGAAGETLGSMDQTVQIAAGQVSSVTMTLRLNPTYVSGSGQPPGGLTVDLVETFLAGTSLKMVGMPNSTMSSLQFEPAGKLWAVKGNVVYPFGPDDTFGTPVELKVPGDPTPPSGARMDGRGNWWAWRNVGSTTQFHQFTTAGAFIRTVSLPGPASISLAAPDGTMCMSLPASKFAAFDATGQELGTFSSPPNVYVAAFNEYWSVPRGASGSGGWQVRRFKPSGELVGEFGHAWEWVANEGRVDADGHVWLIIESKVREYDVDGTLLGTYQAGVRPIALGIDPQGNVWVTSDSLAEFNVTRLSPSGAVNGRQTLPFAGWSVKTDPTGQLWLQGGLQNFGAVAKIVP